MTFQNSQSMSQDHIAVIGTGVRLPGSSDSSSALWNLLIEPRDLLSTIPENRFNSDAFSHPDPDHHGSTNIKGSYFLDEDIRKFDASFFNIKPKEAHAIDPQQRILLEVVYEALETAGLSIEAMAGSQTGIFVGMMCSDYTDQIHKDIQSMPTYAGTGISRSLISNRVSYFFDWHGPSMTIDTACSSSLVAVHQAVQLLRSGTGSDIAVVAGANLILGPFQFVEFSKLHMLSSDSRCRMWDQDASGYARGEGVAAVVLKRLSSAIADGDHIECIIKESGINQDGRTKGITMPSSTAQTNLITSTYARAGLDPKNPTDRCQYFEAHGTGTQAGDPREAEAISSSFFGPGEITEDPLYVGSIKTVVGHTEGTAGLAGLIKASLALQYGVIPPNYNFNKLSPAVEPFYTNLKILKSAKAWPELPEGIPRRASINSFGFGGTNAHVILENFVASAKGYQQKDLHSFQQLTPFNFSAATTKSLRATMSGYLSYLQKYPETNLRDLSYTLHTRRSNLGLRISASATNTPDLIKKIRSILGDADKTIGTQSKLLSGPARILGIFTGQGAQWASMGKELVMNIPQLQETIQSMDEMLQNLPAQERPSWSLLEELLRDAGTSRIGTAAIGQPLCTMVQLLLYDLLLLVGIRFESVIGHSGGEVAAAYAAGFISRDDALKIAYFRGLTTDLNPPISPGAMMAIGTSVPEAYDLCRKLGGRVEVAAINSASSITVAGDLDAIHEGKDILDAKNKFARVLKVDKAYHSRHIVPAGKSYVEALRKTIIRVQHPRNDCPTWYSSVFENRVMGNDDDLTAEYWTDNMVRPVLFSHAIACAMQNTEIDLAIEVGPHPTLKGPALQTLSPHIPYTGVLKRGHNDVEAFSDSLGYVWSQISQPIVDFGRCDNLVPNLGTPNFVTGLPTYLWDHQTAFWHSSSTSNSFLNPKHLPNPLLGSWMSDTVDGEMRWRNLLRLEELPWLRDHKLQGQIVFPASAFLSTAIEAALELIPQEQTATLIEVENFIITRPLVFKDDDNGIETIFTVSDIRHDEDGRLVASFRHYACTSGENDTSSIHATGIVAVTILESSDDLLPRISDSPPNTVTVSNDQFYTSLAPLGYAYSGSFKQISSIKRRLDFASTTVVVPPEEKQPHTMLLHPGMLECALQGMLLAYSNPSDGGLESLYVLNGLKRLRVNIPQCHRDIFPGAHLQTHVHLEKSSFSGRRLIGDTELYSMSGSGLIQFENLQLVPLVGPTPEADQQLFVERRWGPAFPSARQVISDPQDTAENREFANALERICLHYMKKVLTEFPPSIRQNLDLPWHFSCVFAFFSHVFETTLNGTRQWADCGWVSDTDEDIEVLKRKYADRVDVHLSCMVGDNLSSVIRGETTMLQHMTKDNLLDRYYSEGLGMKEYSAYLAETVKQLVHRYGEMDILEIGAGTGGATKLIMEDVDQSFSSYTYTDISTGFFETARQVFSSRADKMIFKTLNVENDISSQGFEEHSYDLVIASLVLHATVDLNHTLANVRRLLKPGGYLIMTEVTNNDVSRLGFMMCAMPGWWLGQKEGRILSPCVPTSQWNDLLIANGFNGVDSATIDRPGMSFPLNVIVSRAVAGQTSFLLESFPLQSFKAPFEEEFEVILVGGQTWTTAPIVEETVHILQQASIGYTMFESLAEIDGLKSTKNYTALFLEETETLVSNTILDQSLSGLKKLTSTVKSILYIEAVSTWKNRSIRTNLRLSRGLALMNDEDCAIQYLRLDPGKRPTAQQIVRTLLRLYYGSKMGQHESSNMLWTNEPELGFKDGQICVPRVYHDNAKNDRFNSASRNINKTVNAQGAILELMSRSDLTYNLVEHSMVDAADTIAESLLASDHVLMNVTHSVLNPLDEKSPPSYLLIGTDVKTNVTTAAISSSNCSRVWVHKRKTMSAAGVSEEDRPQFLAQLYNKLQIESILAVCTENSVIVLHEPCHELATGIIKRAVRKNLTAFFTTSLSISREGDNWIKVTDYSSKRQIRSTLPNNVSLFIDCSTSGPSTKSGSVIASCLPDTCLKIIQRAVPVPEYILSSVASVTDARRTVAIQDIWPSKIPLMVTNLNEVVGTSTKFCATATIIDWKACSTVSIQVSPIDTKIAFKADRTYALFQLPTRIYQSLSEWMFHHGAQNIVVTSHSRIDERWLHHIQSRGLNIKILDDMTADKHALASFLEYLKKEWPPIAGLAHGGMLVQRDAAFSKMSIQVPPATLQTGIHGINNLNESFQHAEVHLEFFLLLSSLSAAADRTGFTIGDPIDAFIGAIANQRRVKNLAASVLHIGDIAGLEDDDSDHLARDTLIDKRTAQTLSERNLHICFAESIMASNPIGHINHEIIAGLPFMTQGDENVRFSMDPRFQHILPKERSTERSVTAKEVKESTKSHLLNAQTLEDVLEIVTEAFLTKLKTCLQLSSDHDRSRILSSRTEELGIDSLVAVDISSWFLREIETEVSVFKILAGNTIAKLVKDVGPDVPSHLTPGISGYQSQLGIKVKDLNAIEGRGSSSMGERSVTVSVMSSTGPSDQGDEQSEATDTSYSEKSFGKA